MTRRCVVGIDPSTSSSGWCVMVEVDGDWIIVDHGQCPADDVCDRVLEVLPGDVSVSTLAIEGMFKGPAKNGKVMPPAYWAMGYAAGTIKGALTQHPEFDDAEVWRPQPNEWRDALNIKRGNRKAVTRRVINFSSDVIGSELLGPKGGQQPDRAMAIGIAYAAARRLTFGVKT